jgi:hypothetical protein
MRHAQNQYRAGEGSLRWGIRWNRNWNVGGHLPSMRRFDPEQDHHEWFWNRILASIGYGDTDRRVGLRDIGRDDLRNRMFRPITRRWGILSFAKIQNGSRKGCGSPRLQRGKKGMVLGRVVIASIQQEHSGGQEPEWAWTTHIYEDGRKVCLDWAARS